MKQWKTVRAGHPDVGEHRERVVPRVARVDHQGAVELVGQLHLRPERERLLGALRVLVEEVEPALADPGDQVEVVTGERLERVPLLAEVRGVVGVEADGGPHLGMAPGDLDRAPRALEVGPDADQGVDPGGVGVGDGGLGVLNGEEPSVPS